ncbi:J domain-containing protein [Ezakiella peruensis]|uniref:J domain-containing protein n=1 Tax=Ezakiella peruensis TaxID=1464038 RepID=UPI001FE4C88E|nr:DnaJ domain-containing protein [Ezakiella peruensis]
MSILTIFLLIILFIIFAVFFQFIAMPVFGLAIMFLKDLFAIPVFLSIQMVESKMMKESTTFFKIVVFLAITITGFRIIYKVVKKIADKSKLAFYIMTFISSAWISLTSVKTYYEYIMPSIRAITQKGYLNKKNPIPEVITEHGEIASQKFLNFKMDLFSDNAIINIIYFIGIFALAYFIKCLIFDVDIPKIKKKNEDENEDEFEFNFEDDNYNYNYYEEENHKQNESHIKDYYSILDVSKNASIEEIRLAYRRQIAKYHPDKNSGSTNSTEITKLINEAYDILSDPEKRDQYDRFGIVL